MTRREQNATKTTSSLVRNTCRSTSAISDPSLAIGRFRHNNAKTELASKCITKIVQVVLQAGRKCCPEKATYADGTRLDRWHGREGHSYVVVCLFNKFLRKSERGSRR
jgi:hypothetical protein